MSMKRGVLIVVFLVFSILIIQVISAIYPSEILPKSELLKSVLNSKDIKKDTQELISNIIEESSKEIQKNPKNDFQVMIYNFYHNNVDVVGEPKLIFDEEKAFVYVVPLMKDGLIVSFIEIDPYTGKVLDYPGWNGDGETYLKVNNDFWTNLEKDIAKKTNMSFNNETRIVSIRNSPFTQMTYIVTPEISTNVEAHAVNKGNEPNTFSLDRALVGSFIEDSPSFLLNESPEVYSESINQVQTEKSLFDVDTSLKTASSYPLVNDFLIPNWDKLPFKNQLTQDSWVDYVNENFDPIENWKQPNDWFVLYYVFPGLLFDPNHKTSNPWKCLSYGASTVADWFDIRQNKTLDYYRSFTNGEIEQGNNPRELEIMYHLRNKKDSNIYLYADSELSELRQVLADILGLDRDPVTREKIPYNINGYAEILKNPENLTNLGDLILLNPSNDFRYSVASNEYPIKDYMEFLPTENNLKWALLNKGIVYIHTIPGDLTFAITGIPVHATALIGFGGLNGEEVFVYHDSYGTGGSEYDIIKVDKISQSIYFIPKEIQNISIICSQNSDCGIASFYNYCNENNTCEVALTYICHNSGTEQSYCTTSTTEECNPCSYGCNEINYECKDKPSSELVINSPSQSLFSERRVQFNLTMSEEVDEITYIDNSNNRPRETVLCRRNCLGYGYDKLKLKSFNDGLHNISFKAIKNDIIVDEKTSQFIVDSKKPIIRDENPRSRSFVNSSTFFEYEFKEDNPSMSEMYVNGILISSKVPRYIEGDDFYFGQYLSYYNGQEIEYYFVLRDIVNNSDESRHINVTVDTTPPVLNDFNYSLDRRRVEFVFNVTELNFDEINYIDLNDKNPKEKTLCSRLKEELCKVKRSFSTGKHNLTINILDKAGNSIQEQANFFV